METFQLMDISYDQWMNISAGVGMLLLFSCFWLQTTGWLKGAVWSLYLGKIIGFGLLAIPLSTRWFLSESLILMISMVIVMVSAFFIFLRRRGI